MPGAERHRRLAGAAGDNVTSTPVPDPPRPEGAVDCGLVEAATPGEMALVLRERLTGRPGTPEPTRRFGHHRPATLVDPAATP